MKTTKRAAPRLGVKSRRRVPQYKLTKADKALVLDYLRRRFDYERLGGERPELPCWARIPSQGPGENDAMFEIRSDKWRAFGKFCIETEYPPRRRL
jgi:hypothetical protein